MNIQHVRHRWAGSRYDKKVLLTVCGIKFVEGNPLRSAPDPHNPATSRCQRCYP